MKNEEEWSVKMSSRYTTTEALMAELAVQVQGSSDSGKCQVPAFLDVVCVSLS